MNVLTFDIEEWYLVKTYYGGDVNKYKEYDNYLAEILCNLEKHRLKGTFFCVGGVAREFPEVVRRIADAGHEIGCHSNVHTWLNKMTPQECLEDTRAAVDALEQCIGQKVKSYRAPAFSIGESNKWAFEVLAECGIERDASIFPATRDFGGFSAFGQKTPTIVRYNGIELKEFPICTTRLLGREVAYSGGGYFRFFPLWFVKKEMACADYAMTYFHLADFISQKMLNKEEFEAYFKVKGSLWNRYVRYIKRNLGVGGAYKKCLRLIRDVPFINIEQAASIVDWKQVPIVEF